MIRALKTAAVGALVCSCGQAWALPPHVRVVNPLATEAGDGSSWAAPYSDLQMALDAAAASNGEVTELWLAAGEYVPSRERVAGVAGSRTFQLVDRVAIYGGFAGMEEERAQRNVQANPTVLTGATLEVRPFHIVTAQHVGREAVLDGVRITGGASGVYGEDSRGGGVTIISASPTIRNCEIVDNRALSGGGVAINGGSPLFVRTRIADNAAVSMGAGGGGVLIMAGIPAFVRCTIESNRCDGPAPGGGLSIQGGTVSIRDSKLIGNCSETGGALYASAGSTTIANSLVRGNGDGISGQNLTILQCTIIDNIPHQSLAWAGVSGTGVIVGSIVWGNADFEMHGVLPQVWGGLQVRHSCIAPNTHGPAIEGPGVIRQDPLLTETGELANSSPCIDAGDNSAVPAWMTLDLNGNPRFVDDTGMANGSNAAPVIDLGAYEYQGSSCYANCDGSTSSPRLTVADFVCFLSRFSSGDPWANCDGSQSAPVLNTADFTCFLAKFTAGCP